MSLRLFVAIELPEDVRQAAADAAEAALQGAPEWRLTHRDELHVTLAFLGAAVDPALLDPIQERLREAASVAMPFATSLRGLESFPEEGRARVVWVGLDNTGARLAALADTVASVLRNLVDLDERPFRAHLTVARARRPARLPAALLAASVEPRSFEVREITLFRSTPSAAPGARYEALGRWPLGPLAP